MVFDTLLGWTLSFHPALSILILSLIVSIIITLAIKFFTDQSLMKDLKEELKELQRQMKELRNNPKKLAKVNDRVMEANMKYMTHSMRPTLFTFIPIILVFGWMNMHIGFYPLMPNEPFQLTAVFEDGSDGQISMVLPEGITLLEGAAEREVLDNEVQWTLSGEPGEYALDVMYKGKTYTKDIIIADEPIYAPVEKSFRKSYVLFTSPDENGLNTIKLSNKQIIPFEDVPVMKDIPWISTFNWFWTYFLFSLVFSMGLRRALNIY